MQAKFYQAGDCIDYTPGTAKSAGDVVVQNGMVGFVTTDLAANEKGSLCILGVADTVKANGAINAGNALYWDADGDPQGGTAGTGCLTTTAAANDFAGWAVEAAGANDERVKCLFVRTPSLTVGDITKPIADPGNAGAIPVTSSGYVPLVTAGAETRTLAAPTFIGQQLLLYMKTDGGDCVVTCATTINETGNNTITFDNTGEALRLTAVEEGANLRWRLAQADGAGLSTV